MTVSRREYTTNTAMCAKWGPDLGWRTAEHSSAHAEGVLLIKCKRNGGTGMRGHQHDQRV